MRHALHSPYLAGQAGVASRVRRAMRQFPMRFPVHLSTALAISAAMAILPAPASAAQPWMNPALAPEARAALLVCAMTLDQKEEQLVGTLPGILPELPQCKGGRHVSGIPSLSMPTLRIRARNESHDVRVA